MSSETILLTEELHVKSEIIETNETLYDEMKTNSIGYWADQYMNGKETNSNEIQNTTDIYCAKEQNNEAINRKRSKLYRNSTRYRIFQCKECNLRFNRVNAFKRHLITHYGHKLHKCDECSKSFTYLRDLKKHLRMHTGEKSFECPECFKKFSQPNNLKQHKLTHTGEKNYECKECLKRFAYACNLKRHMLVHTGERPFKCNLCEQNFKERKQLKRHALQHI